MTDKAPLKDRIAFALLVPSLVVPIAAIALAAWRMGHLDDAHLAQHPGIGMYYFAAMITLSATLFSMTINSVFAVRNHGSLGERTIPLSRLAPHYAVTLIVAVWAVQFCVVQLESEGPVFGILLVFGSIFSCAVVLRDRIIQRSIDVVTLSPRVKRALIGYPVAVALALGIAIWGYAAQSELQIIGVALLGVLGLPWTGLTVLFWLPLAAIFGGLGGEALPSIFLILSAIPAMANGVVAVVFLRSSAHRTSFVNDFLEARSFAEAHRNTLAP